MHKVIALSNVLKLNAPAHPVVWTTAEHAAAAARLWPEAGTPTLAPGPTANWGGQIWPGDRFAELALRLTPPGGLLPNAPLLVLGGPGEESLATPPPAGAPAPPP